MVQVGGKKIQLSERDLCIVILDEMQILPLVLGLWVIIHFEVTIHQFDIQQ